MQRHNTDHAPAAIGPYSQAISVDGWLFTSGQIGLDPATGELTGEDFESQARQVMENLGQVLASAGCSFGDVVRTTIYLSDFADFATINSIYGDAMGDQRPARSTVQAAALPMGAKIEIDVVARQPAP